MSIPHRRRNDPGSEHIRREAQKEVKRKEVDEENDFQTADNDETGRVSTRRVRRNHPSGTSREENGRHSSKGSKAPASKKTNQGKGKRRNDKKG